MKRLGFKALMVIPLIVTVGFSFDKKLDKEKAATGIDLPVQEWKLPAAMQEDGYIDESKMPKNSKYTEMVVLGNKILNETSKYIGPTAKDPKMRYAGSNLSCSSCHANGGTNQYQSAFVGIWGRFPQYRSRSDSINTLEDRINGCMQRSLNGKALPVDSKEMKAIVTYMQWLSQGIPVGAKVKGQGLVKMELMNRAADPKKGKIVFEEKCVACHQADGQGIKNESGEGAYYTFPPLWGKDSYNTGAGMHRELKAAAYIKANMPQGNPDLTDEEAYDVAAYINSQPRPIKAGGEKDFPDKRVKPVDAVTGPYNDNFSQKQHQFGPYKPMMK
ncbi:c-type cytochrome [Helicobacter sp. faydin-H76]|uniref:C-type cytochrome n=2 Tax=Helicobacter cappadocius TaxID=3063998 RepID=A0AA90Q3U2_9HELI|nr:MULTISPECIES: c-type cytochrome [unclassified Helicobacter]MDO7253725.1 c-type cytochrome [Helicobacter sp. faydin-H75]MDP2539653.1 c-type cytochrome [Helicobacter sp. faydin-H76]